MRERRYPGGWELNGTKIVDPANPKFEKSKSRINGSRRLKNPIGSRFIGRAGMLRKPGEIGSRDAGRFHEKLGTFATVLR
jgi:hypothetical protein